jgi:hypothetical protein
MTPGDVPLFASFVLTPEGQTYEAWAFDVHIGSGVQTPGLSSNPTLFDIGAYLTQLRIDAVGWRNDQPTIFEVKPLARLSAVGQLVTYCDYYAQQFGYDCTKIALTDYANPFTIEIMSRRDISVIQVPFASTDQIAQAVTWVRSLPYRAY